MNPKTKSTRVLYTESQFKNPFDLDPDEEEE